MLALVYFLSRSIIGPEYVMSVRGLLGLLGHLNHERRQLDGEQGTLWQCLGLFLHSSGCNFNPNP